MRRIIEAEKFEANTKMRAHTHIYITQVGTQHGNFDNHQVKLFFLKAKLIPHNYMYPQKQYKYKPRRNKW
jgi:hypothetical protein